MSQQHRATPDNWHNLDQYRRLNRVPDHISITLELADRLAAAEQRISELEGNRQASLDSSAPAGSLVAQVNAAMDCVYHEKGTSDGEAEAAIYAVADWLDSQNVGAGRAAARWLREEVERNG